MSDSVYTKRIEWAFEIRNDNYAVSSIEQGEGGTFLACVYETRRNGQEDTHQSADIEWSNGKWRYLDKWGGKSFDNYGSVSASQILDFLNENPLPKEAFEFTRRILSE